MRGKIVIAIKDQFLSRIYVDFFREENFLVSVAEKSDQIFPLISQEMPDVILLDISFAEEKDFGILKELKADDSARKIPIVLISHHDEERYRKKAVEFEVKDFLVGEYSSPLIILRRIRTHLGGEKSYRLSIDAESEAIREIAEDLGHKDLSCKRCGGDLEMVMIRDLSKGDNYFKISFICPACGI
ncbi:MAG: response regulator [Candidatus Ratteibacteria bacterium]